MRIWFQCIKRAQRDKYTHNSPFINLNDSDYSYSEVYLGAQSIVNIYPKDLVLRMSYSVKDGILINIKKNGLHRILFDYVDGAYYINDDSSRGYDHLVELLITLKKQSKEHHYMDIYENLEAIMFKFITNHYNL